MADPVEPLRQRLATRWMRFRETFRLRLVPVRTRYPFHVVSAARNVAPWIERHLESVFTQAYPHHLIRHVLVDDASTDETRPLVEAWLSRHPRNSVEYIRNTERLGGCANLTREFRKAPRGSIVLQVDGDDWLPDPGVLEFLNRVYQDSKVWMTSNSWEFPDGRRAANSEPVPERVVAEAGYRDYRWITSHLHSFRRELFDHVEDSSLLDPTTGEYWSSAVDMAHYLPMLELAGEHARHVHRVTYVYNPHEGSIINADRERQRACELRIRSLPRYAPLGELRART